MKVPIENVNVPGRITHVDAEKYAAMRQSILRVTPKAPPGLTAAEMIERVRPHLPEELWPNGEKVGWWQKTVQLDLEAKGLLTRSPGSEPLRWHRT